MFVKIRCSVTTCAVIIAVLISTVNCGRILKNSEFLDVISTKITHEDGRNSSLVLRRLPQSSENLQLNRSSNQTTDSDGSNLGHDKHTFTAKDSVNVETSGNKSSRGVRHSGVMRTGHDGFEYCASVHSDGSALIDCVKTRLVELLQRLVRSKLTSVPVLDGIAHLDRKPEVKAESSNRSISDHLDAEVARALNDVSNQYALRVEVFPGVTAKLARSLDGEAVEMRLKLDKEMMGRGKKGIGKDRQKLKMLQSLVPILMIPFAIQMLLLPWFLAKLQMMAMGSVLAGKLAILVTLFNYFRYLSLRTQNDVYQEHLAHGHYGYDGSTEFGAWFNGRKRRDASHRRLLAYRGHER